MTDCTQYPHLTEDEFYAKCKHYEALGEGGDYYKETEEYIYFKNSAGCTLASWEKETGVYREF